MPEATEVADVVRARRIELVDARGIVRAILSTTIDDDLESVSLGLRDDYGYERVSLNVDNETSAIEFWHEGNMLASLRCDGNGRASLVLSDEDGNPMTVVSNAA